MKKKKNIENKNNNGQYHGYQEWYNGGKPYLRVTMKNNQPHGYEEYHFPFQAETNYYIK